MTASVAILDRTTKVPRQRSNVPGPTQEVVAPMYGEPYTQDSTGTYFTCERCGAKVKTKPSHLGRRRYCSKDCMYALVRQQEPPNQNGGLCECGCGDPAPIATTTATAVGHIAGQPMRFIRGHNNAGRRMKLDRWREEDRGFETPCWVWTLMIGTQGYGIVATKRQPRRLAHRVVYEEVVGPIPAAHELHHRCENPRCVNPDHLEPVTRAEHAKRHVELRKGG
jgi:hypothetical protein